MAMITRGKYDYIIDFIVYYLFNWWVTSNNIPYSLSHAVYNIRSDECGFHHIDRCGIILSMCIFSYISLINIVHHYYSQTGLIYGPTTNVIDETPP